MGVFWLLGVGFFLCVCKEEQQSGRFRRAVLDAGMLCWYYLSGSELLWGMLPASPLQSKRVSARTGQRMPCLYNVFAPLKCEA